ncbi:MAG TPA: DUF3037 domain-containing protein [Kofleriaceae bacterium]|nr:DUF3037 domain-containing protein [Kofleriaceae bacterium]
MSALVPFEYAVLRVMPRVDRGECINVGLVLYCQRRDYLDAAIHIDDDRLRAIDPDIDVEGIHTALEAIATLCRADVAVTSRHGGGRGSVFGWITAPRSTVVQAGPVHPGITADPAADLQRLLDRLVR